MIEIILIVLSFAIIIVVGEFFLVRWIWPKGAFGKTISTCSFLMIAWFAWNIYSAVYPPDSFYEDEFKKVTGLDFPKSGSITFNDATYPDLHGDYSSCAQIQLSDEDYQTLLIEIRQRKYQGGAGSASLDNITKHIGVVKFVAEASTETNDTYGYWALLEDRHAVLVHYVRW